MAIPKRYYRYGIAPEKQILDLVGPQLYDGVVLPAHLVVDQRDSISKWLVDKRFYIDPMTHVFYNPLSDIINGKGDFKRPYDKLREQYGPPYSSIPGPAVKLSPGRVMNSGPELIDSVQRIVSFQEDFVTRAFHDNEIDELNELAREGGIEDAPMPELCDVKPEFVVLPYVMFSDIESDEYKLNSKIWEVGSTINSDLPKYALIATKSPNIDLAKLSADLKGKVDGVILWFSDIDEYESPASDLISVRRVIRYLHDQGFVVRMHSGGPFFMGLGDDGLASVAGGISYGEVRKSFQVQGGPIPQRYYVPQLMNVYPKGETGFILRIVPLICPDPCCKDLSTGELMAKMFPGDPDTTFGPMLGIKTHYLYSFRRSTSELWANGKQEGIDEIKRTISRIGIQLPKGICDHLDTWVKVYSVDDQHILISSCSRCGKKLNNGTNLCDSCRTN